MSYFQSALRQMEEGNKVSCPMEEETQASRQKEIQNPAFWQMNKQNTASHQIIEEKTASRQKEKENPSTRWMQEENAASQQMEIRKLKENIASLYTEKSAASY